MLPPGKSAGNDGRGTGRQGMEMSKKHRFAVLDPDRKNRRKKIRSVIQAAIIALLAFVLVQEVFLMKTYEPPDAPMVNDEGFVAISYPGASRDGSGHSLSKEELTAHLSALKRLGFETVSQDQIKDFYRDGSPLPEKALFLSFEDGQRDTVIYAQPALEKLNYKSTMFTFANQLESDDRSFLRANHLKTMIKSGYWETGSNGYRQAYINAFDREGRYLGELDTDQVTADMNIVRSSHPLMDFLRDENGIPKEDAERMKERISGEYAKMKEVYIRQLGALPDAYALPRPNALYHGMHPAVEVVNDQKIRTYYKLHFNRSRGLFNGSDDSVTDLTRLRVGADWPVNHLLMEIREETGMPVSFETGDPGKADQWTIRDGAAEFRGEKVILTSESGAEVTALLNEPLPVDAVVEVLLGRDAAVGIAYGTDRVIRLSEEEGRLIVRQGKKILSKHEVPGGADGTEIQLEVRNSRLNVRVNDALNLTIVIGDPNPKEGYQLQLAGMPAGPAAGDEEAEITDAVFTHLHITSGDSVLYSDVPSGSDKTKAKVAEWFNHMIDSLMDRF
jgi:hypothetical protein